MDNVTNTPQTAPEIQPNGSSPQRQNQFSAKRRRPGRRKRIIKRILVTVVILGILGGMGWLTYTVFFKPTPVYNHTGLIEIWDGTDEDKPSEIKNSINGYGFLQPEKSETVTISGEGTVLQSSVSYMMQVSEGDILAVLDSSAIDKAVADYNKQIAAAENDISKLYEDIGKVEKQIAQTYEELSVANAEELERRRAARMYAPFAGRLEDVSARSVGEKISAGTYLGNLVDNSRMKLNLYFSYGYEGDIYVGQSCEVSISELMAMVNGKVTAVDNARHIVEGVVSFAVEITIDNPGTLTDSMIAVASMRTAGGELIFPVKHEPLEYYRIEPLFAKSVGTLKQDHLRNYSIVREGDLLLELEYIPNTEIEEGYMGQVRIHENTIAGYEAQIEAKREQIEAYLKNIENEYLRVDDLTFRSPISGTIMNYPEIWPGMTLSQNRPVNIQIAQIETLTLRGEIYQSDVQKVQVGMEVTVDAYVMGEMTRVTGVLTNIERSAVQTGGQAYFPVTISVDNSRGQIMEGTGANFSIDLDVSVNPIIVPFQAVKPYGNKDYVFVKTPDGNPPEGSVELREGVVPKGFFAVPVKCGIQSARSIEIVEGIPPEWRNWEVFTQKSENMPEPLPEYDFDPGTDDPLLLEWFEKGYQKGLEESENSTPETEEPGNEWEFPGGEVGPGIADIYPPMIIEPDIFEEFPPEDGIEIDDGGADGGAVTDSDQPAEVPADKEAAVTESPPVVDVIIPPGNITVMPMPSRPR